jgi:hypothetical protein
MFQYRQALVRMRQGDSDRQIAGARIMGRRGGEAARTRTAEHGWLDVVPPCPRTRPYPRRWANPNAPAPRSPAWRHTASASSAWARTRRQWRGHLRRPPARTGLQRQLLGGAPHAGRHSEVAEPPEATCRLDFEPGDAAQVDFGAGPMLQHPDGTTRRTWAFVMTLCFSRHQYVEFVWDQSAATWLGCHRRAFEWFGAVPARVIIDNAKCAITKACSHDPTVQRAYAECAEGYGFKIDPCPPYDPQKKGIVESGVKYVKGNFLALRTVPRSGRPERAGPRLGHPRGRGSATTAPPGAPPWRCLSWSAPLMQPLPAIAPDLGTWHRVTVHRDCHVKFDYRLYSAPFTLVGKVLWLQSHRWCRGAV